MKKKVGVRLLQIILSHESGDLAIVHPLRLDETIE